MSKIKREDNLQIAVSNYLKFAYPRVIFTSDSSGVKLTMGQAVKLKKMKSNCKIPDMIILEPKGIYRGLILELKAENKSPFLKDGITLSTDKHIQAQGSTLLRLRDKGYFSEFVIGFDHAKKVIDLYMNTENRSI